MGAASAAYCALSAESKPIDEIPGVLPAWQDGAWKARYTQENRRARPLQFEVAGLSRHKSAPDVQQIKIPHIWASH